jgi:hypothetical protein
MRCWMPRAIRYNHGMSLFAATPFAWWHWPLVAALALILVAIVCRRRLSDRPNGNSTDKPHRQVAMRIALILALIYIFSFFGAEVAELFDDPVGESRTAHVLSLVYSPLIALNRLLGYLVAQSR